MSRLLPCFLLLAVTACSTASISPPIASTHVDLSRSNYSVVRADVTGVSRGIKLLGVVPIMSPSYRSAMSDLYSRIGPMEGRSLALVNCIHERSNLYFILFSVPQLTVRADVIEFLDESADPQKQSNPKPEETRP
ncbi:MAG TPA: DUF6567 family protein [Sumerlaeia bacterium]|nr:DUF6567 family protein [Sumerlaeia bacterium]